MADLDTELSASLQPFLDRLVHKKRQQMRPLYLSGLIGPGDRKSIEPMVERFARASTTACTISFPTAFGMLFLSRLSLRATGGQGRWRVRCVSGDRSGLPKKGDHSVGVAQQYASMLGKRANCQTVVSVTLARDGRPAFPDRSVKIPSTNQNFPCFCKPGI
uniref:transposase n=1 Tax=Neorhizobium sp. EC2-8 TaxID=3129230 RepID=UPI0031016E2B